MGIFLAIAGFANPRLGFSGNHIWSGGIFLLEIQGPSEKFNPRGMKKLSTFFSTPVVILITSAVLIFAGCQGPNKATPSAPSTKNAETTTKVAITIEPSAWTAEETTSTEENPPYVNIYLVAIEDNGKSGKLIGCGDSLVAAQVKYGLSRGADTAKDTLIKLFAVKQQYYGESGLYNALYQSDLKVDSLTVDANKKATLNLSGTMMLGGVCDNPRFEEQIRGTVLQFKDLYNDVEIFVNGKPLKELLSGQG